MKQLHTKSSHSTKGFTLIEVVLSLALFVIIISVIYSFITPMITVYSTNQKIAEANELSERIIYQLSEMIEYKEEVYLNRIKTSDISKERIGHDYAEYSILFIDDDGHVKKSIHAEEISELFDEGFYGTMYCSISVDEEKSTQSYLYLVITVFETSEGGMFESEHQLCSYPFTIRLFNAKEVTLAKPGDSDHMMIAYK